MWRAASVQIAVAATILLFGRTGVLQNPPARVDYWANEAWRRAVAKDDDLIPEFENLDLPTADLDAALSEGMPDPTARDEAPVAEEKGGKKKRGKREKKPKAAKTPKAPKPARVKRESSGQSRSFGRITDASPFTVLLAVSLGAIVIAVICMALQLARYGGDYKAKGARQTTSASP